MRVRQIGIRHSQSGVRPSLQSRSFVPAITAGKHVRYSRKYNNFCPISRPFNKPQQKVGPILPVEYPENLNLSLFLLDINTCSIHW